MFKMFKDDARGVFVGVCCAAAVICLENVMSIGVNTDIFQNTDDNGHSVDSVCSLDNIKKLASLAVDDEEAMLELVEILCTPAADYALADLAYWSFLRERDKKPTSFCDLRQVHRIELLETILSSKRYRKATDAKLLWEDYKKYRDVPYTVPEEAMEYFD
jgi:hypothetical protein